VDSRGARNKFWPLWWRVSLSIRLYTTLNHIRFFYHNIKKTKSLPWQLKCTCCIMRMSCLYASDSSFKNFCKLAYINMQKQFEKMLGKKSNDAYLLSIRVHTTKNHISICFFTTQYQRQSKWFFQSTSWKRHCGTHWREQRGMDSYLPWQISQSVCQISSNCTKIVVQTRVT